MEYSIGIVTREECHKTTYGAVNKELTPLSELNGEKQTVLMLRLGECDFSSICKYNEMKYFVKYNHLFGNICCDPLKVHKRTIKKGLREILLEHLKKEKKFPVALVPEYYGCGEWFLPLVSNIVPGNQTTGFHMNHRRPFCSY